MALIDILVGLQHGDEGKGKVSYCLCKTKKYDWCIRFNGGPNAGHTVYHKGEKVVLHHLPCGVLFGYKCLIGPDCVVNLEKLKKEIEYVQKVVKDEFVVKDLIHISYMTHLITPEHITEDCKTDKVGSTKQGIGPCYRDKYWRKGTQIRKHNPDNYTLVNPVDIKTRWVALKVAYCIHTPALWPALILANYLIKRILSGEANRGDEKQNQRQNPHPCHVHFFFSSKSFGLKSHFLISLTLPEYP